MAKKTANKPTEDNVNTKAKTKAKSKASAKATPIVIDPKNMRVIEGALFASHVPLSEQDLVKIFPEGEKPSLGEVREIASQLQAQYAERGIILKQVASGYRFQVIDEVVPYLMQRMDEKPARYSRALLETLALIAYRQPITRGEIEDIRGVVVSTNIVQTLQEQEWIKIVGHKDVPGKPALFATTKIFLDHFGLKSLDELPPLAELKDFEAMAIAAPEAESTEKAEEKTEEQVTSESEAVAETDQTVDQTVEQTIDQQPEVVEVE